ncbi:MAG: STAS/SEC14 domain-containing protein [Gammaproteobacteria bacterium]|nr:STAS/SEC14 domain-containing protein [Gammaproteobacteria bacterium]
MPIKWENESKDLLVARISGVLAESEIAEFQAAVKPIARASAKIQFLSILEDFDGWEAGKDWSDIGAVDEIDEVLSRFAIVGDEKWREKALMFSLAGLRPVEIQFFSSEDEARSWLAGT